MAFHDIFEAVLALDAARTVRLVRAELDRGAGVMAVLNRGLIAAMDEVGERYSRGLFYVPEMLMAAQAMKQGMAVLRPLLNGHEITPGGCVVIGTVKGDRHDIGKNLVAMMLECAGFKVIDLGVDVDAGAFADAARAQGADVVALSALLTSTMAAMEATVSRIRKDGAAPKTLVGGAPVTLAFAESIGADGFSPDAPGAVRAARRLICR